MILNLPILLLVNSLDFTSLQNQYSVLIALVLLMPILFFPSTAAMFASVRQWVIHGTISPLLGSYWTYFNESYKKSFLGGIILTGVWGILIADTYYFIAENSMLLYAVIVMGVLLFTYTMNFLSVLVHYDLKLGMLLRNALLVTVGNPVLVLLITSGSILILYASFYILLFLLPIFTGVFISYLSFFLFHKMYLNVISTL